MNPDLPDAQQSRAGLYLKNMEPNIVSNTAANLRYMIGPMSIARENGMYILPQWRMECDVSGADWYQTTLEMARSRPERPVSPAVSLEPQRHLTRQQRVRHALHAPADGFRRYGDGGVRI